MRFRGQVSERAGPEPAGQATERTKRSRLRRNLWLAAFLVPASSFFGNYLTLGEPTPEAAMSAVVTAVLIGLLALLAGRFRSDGRPWARSSWLVGMALGASLGAWSPPLLMGAADLPGAPMGFEVFFLIGIMLGVAGPAPPIGGFMLGWVVARSVERRRRKRAREEACAE